MNLLADGGVETLMTAAVAAYGGEDIVVPNGPGPRGVSEIDAPELRETVEGAEGA
ncbi:hypothetical protein [Streptomyces decoyicus]